MLATTRLIIGLPSGRRRSSAGRLRSAVGNGDPACPVRANCGGVERIVMDYDPRSKMECNRTFLGPAADLPVDLIPSARTQMHIYQTWHDLRPGMTHLFRALHNHVMNGAVRYHLRPLPRYSLPGTGSILFISRLDPSPLIEL